MFSLHNYDLRLSLQRGIPYVDVLGTFTPSVASFFGVGEAYGSVFVNGHIYAAIANTFPGVVSKIDPVSGSVVANITVGNDPRGLCYDGQFIWCADYDLNGPGNTVTKIDPATDTVVATITVGSKPGFIEYDGLGFVWVCCLGSTNAYKIDIATNAITVVPLGITPRAIAYDNRAYMYFASTSSAILRRVRTTTHALSNVSVPVAPYGLCSAAEGVFATGFNNRVYRVNRMTLGVAAITSPYSPTRRPGFDGKRVWVPCGDAEKTIVIDSDDVVASVSIAGSNRSVCFDGDYAYVSAGSGIAKVALA